MPANKKNALPRTDSLAELVEFFDTHDMGEYWDQMPEADFDIDIHRRKHLVSLDEDLAGDISEDRTLSAGFLGVSRQHPLTGEAGRNALISYRSSPKGHCPRREMYPSLGLRKGDRKATEGEDVRLPGRAATVPGFLCALTVNRPDQRSAALRTKGLTRTALEEETSAACRLSCFIKDSRSCFAEACFRESLFVH